MALWVGLALAGEYTDREGRRADGSAARWVTLGGAVTEWVVELGGAGRLVGVDSSSTFPQELSALPQVGYHRQLGAEGLLALRPELVLATTDSGPEAVLEQVRAAGVPVLELPAEATLDGCRARGEAVAALLGVDPAEVQRRLAGIVARPPGGPRAVFVFGHGSGSLTVAGEGTAAAELLRLAGARPAITAYEGYRPLSAESLLLARPELIVTTDEVLAAVGGREGFAALPAVVAAGSPPVVAGETLLLLGFGPRLAEAVARVQAGF